MSNWKGMEDITSVETFDEDVRSVIEEFCEKENVGDLRKAPQTVFTACMGYVGRRLFKGREFFQEKGRTREKKYSREMLDIGVDYYIDLCRKYDKVCTTAGLTSFLGIGRKFFDLDGSHSAIDDLMEVREKIFQASEDTASEALIGGSRAPMSVLPHLNHFHGWNKEATTETNTQTVLSGAELPRLGMSDAGTK